MYHGYEMMWTFTFVPVGFVITMLAFLAFCFVYAVGASRGGAAAAAWVRFWGWAFLGASAADLVWAAATGSLGAFVELYGVTPLVEMTVLALLCVGSMWFMATAYVRGRLAHDAVQHPRPEGSDPDA